MGSKQLQESILEKLSSEQPTLRRDLSRAFQHRQAFKEAYDSLLVAEEIQELGTGRANDPVIVYRNRPDLQPVDHSQTYPFVTKVPRAVWTEFVTNCFLAAQEPEIVLAELLARPVPSISQITTGAIDKHTGL